MIKSVIAVLNGRAASAPFTAVLPVLVILFTVTSISCAGKKIMPQNVKNLGAGLEDASRENVSGLSGIYKSVNAGNCNMAITIKMNNGVYTYTISGSGVKSSGILSVNKDSDQTYLGFNGTLRSGDRTAVEGLYSGKTITIQNYGNSMNRYVCFKECDAKYLEFAKSE